ncbi:MAG: hypothetical protein SF187_03895 [Deltaproteobacteria bacterium]|nr:hypothetical protein [Deltaproteobacteria bacterium]
MKNAMFHFRGRAGRSLSTGLLSIALCSGCGDDNDDTPSVTADAGVDVLRQVMLPPSTGASIPPAGDAGTLQVTLDSGYTNPEACCPTTLWIADVDGNEATAKVIGELPPLSQGVALAWSGGRWSASVCLPLNSLLSYRFYFGKKPVEATDQDAATNTEDGGVDAAAPETTDDYRYNPLLPTEQAGFDEPTNVFLPTTVCAGPNDGGA